jgi:hypothetical protein
LNDFWTNVYGQIHYWWQAAGIGIVSAVALYIVGNADWTVRGAIVVVVTGLTAALTRDDHKKTEQVAAQKAAGAGEVPGKEQI